MSSDKHLFEAPTKYPEPPRDMYYQVPPKSPQEEKLAPIFPWEIRAPKPTRVFPQEKKSVPEPEPEPEPMRAASETTEETATNEASPVTPALPQESDPWTNYSRLNAWDEMPEINRYVQAVQQNRRGKVQVLHNTSTQQTAEPLSSPTNEDRRPSMRLTDFPTEFERPSLPVTPAPIRKPSFWGEERDEQGDLPAAQGVPKQEDWVSKNSIANSIDKLSALPLAFNFMWKCQFCGKQNPVARLEELQRRQSELLEKAPQTVPDLPKREMPGSSSKEEAEAADERAITSPPTERPAFREPNFGSSSGPGSANEQSPAAVRSHA